MTEATRKTSPSVYGILFTETDPAGVSLKGTLNRPYLTGKLFIREANLTFPPTKTTQLANSNLSLQYRVLDDTSKVITTDQKVSKYYVAAEESSDTTLDQPLESPIIDRLRYNVVVETRGPTTLTMIFTPTTGEELYAELDGKVSVVNEQGVAAIYGEIEVSPRSYYNFFKRFDASGKLKFVGQWNNPELDIQANYEGYKQETSQQISEQQPGKQAVPDGSQLKEQKVIVELKITGTRYEPKLSMGMKVHEKTGEEPVDYSTLAKGGDVQSDAISFIITGKFRDELTSREQQEFTDLGAATGTSVASSLLSSIFSDVLKREFPFIRRADVTYRGGSVQEGTSVNVTATAFKGYLRVGGKIFQDIGNANVSYQLSLGDFFNATSIRNLYFEIQRKVEGDNPEDKKLTNEARFFYRFSF
ncbi:MAG: translocation/assembly module TamB domain-containing protein [Ignavibacteriales bacterium]|nr:translocation/assembly module TamB domain-containing protein [Ignavibacteriales bacterium]